MIKTNIVEELINKYFIWPHTERYCMLGLTESCARVDSGDGRRRDGGTCSFMSIGFYHGYAYMSWYIYEEDIHIRGTRGTVVHIVCIPVS